MGELTLQLLFSGLIAFSPNADGTQATVLVLNDINSHHMPHQAFLTVQSGAVDEADNDFLFVDAPTVSGRYFKRTFVGSGYELLIKGPPSGESLSYSDCRNMPPRPLKEPVTVCLLKARDLWPNARQPDAGALLGTSARVAKDVALRFLAKIGKLRPYDQTEDGFFSARKVGCFKPPGEQVHKEQYVPELMEWVLPNMAGSEATLVLRPLGGGSDREIRIKPDPDTHLVQVRISNDPDPLAFCSMDPADRHKVAHLGRLARFTGGEEIDSAEPIFQDERDKAEIDRFCKTSKRQPEGVRPIVCYGVGTGGD